MKKLISPVSAIVAVLVITLILSNCKQNDSKPNPPAPKDGCAYYTIEYDLPQTQSEQLLGQYMASEHFEYDLDGWFFFGTLVDSLDPDDLGIFFITVQRMEEGDHGFKFPVVPAVVGFNSKSRGNYLWRGTITLDVDSLVTVESNPWDVKVSNPLQEEPQIHMQLTSGTMGAKDATYKLRAKMFNDDLVPLVVDVQIKDRYGAINEGNGTASFMAQFLTEEQRNYIMNSSDRRVSAYQEETGDPMSCQGSFYYSLPLLDVEHFSIIHQDTIISQGSDGVLWMDYVVESYDQQALEAIEDVSWEFYAIQFPDINTALMVIEITTKTGTLPIAKLFNMDSEKTLNNASIAKHSWAIDEVNIEAVPGFNWTSPKSHESYNTSNRIQLMSDDYSADLSITMITDDQEIYIDNEISGKPVKMVKYEGIASVEGTLNGVSVSGQAFVELQPVGGRK